MRVAFWCGVGLVCFAFAAGFAWRNNWFRAESGSEPMQKIGLAQRGEALGLLDRAIEAKYNELWTEATRLAFEARETDPATPGVDIFIGEMALERDDINVMGSAARAALRRQPASANAKLLLALQAWVLRGQTGATEAGTAAAQTLQEAATDELSNGPVRFFAGDFLRAIGRPAEAHANLLGSLYRLHAWQSAALIAAKFSLALEEAPSSVAPISAALSDPHVERFGASSADLHRAIANDGAVSPAVSALRSFYTAKQIEVLARDPAFSAVSIISEPAIGSIMPFSDIGRPDEVLGGESDAPGLGKFNSLEAN